jgi:hypothetical protein
MSVPCVRCGNQFDMDQVVVIGMHPRTFVSQHVCKETCLRFADGQGNTEMRIKAAEREYKYFKAQFPEALVLIPVPGARWAFVGREEKELAEILRLPGFIPTIRDDQVVSWFIPQVDQDIALCSLHDGHEEVIYHARGDTSPNSGDVSIQSPLRSEEG